MPEASADESSLFAIWFVRWSQRRFGACPGEYPQTNDFFRSLEFLLDTQPLSKPATNIGKANCYYPFTNRKMSLGGYFIVIWCNINQHSTEKEYFYVLVCIYLFFSVYNDFFSLNLFEAGDLMLTVYSSHSLPVQGANVIQQHHPLWGALK